MFFSKNEPAAPVSPQNIAILGVSALGLYWADVFQNLGHRVCVLCPPQTADEFNATDFIFKDSSRLKNPRNNFHFCHELPFRPQFLLLASAPEYRRADLTLLAPAVLADTTVIGFCPPEDGAVLAEVVKKPVINGYFDAWLDRSKNHVYICGHSQKLTFSLNDTSPEAAVLSELFEPSGIKPVFAEDDKTNLWNFVAPRLAYALLNAVYDQNIFQLAKTESGRKTIDSLLTEISRLAAADNAFLPETSLLAKLYEIPSGWVSPLQKSIRTSNPLYFERLITFIIGKGGKNDKKYPLLHSLICQIYNKY